MRSYGTTIVIGFVAGVIAKFILITPAGRLSRLTLREQPTTMRALVFERPMKRYATVRDLQRPCLRMHRQGSVPDRLKDGEGGVRSPAGDC